MHTYLENPLTQPKLWTVGHYQGEDFSWVPLKDFGSEKEAAAYANYLNGGDGKTL